MKNCMPQNFGDLLALLLVFIIPALWLIQAITKIDLRNDVNGALVVIFTLVVQHYFRKAQSEKH